VTWNNEMSWGEISTRLLAEYTGVARALTNSETLAAAIIAATINHFRRHKMRT
jgi:hypothetical protein